MLFLSIWAVRDTLSCRMKIFSYQHWMWSFEAVIQVDRKSSILMTQGSKPVEVRNESKGKSQYSEDPSGFFHIALSLHNDGPLATHQQLEEIGCFQVNIDVSIFS